MPNWVAFLGPLAAGSAASLVSMGEVKSAWYLSLKKPAWQPPAKLFGPVWTVLYLLMGAALATALSAGLKDVSWFALQMVLNLTWTFTFFNMKNLNLAFANICGLVFAILGTMASFAAVSPLAAAMMLPYLAWVLFATALNASILSENENGADGGNHIIT
jgi:benzodiazapine receptor